MLSTEKRYESTVSDFQTPDAPVEKYEYQEEVSHARKLAQKLYLLARMVILWVMRGPKR
ncbi:hypothetical protein Lser_V15G24440 [Lactuca serriola]